MSKVPIGTTKETTRKRNSGATNKSARRRRRRPTCCSRCLSAIPPAGRPASAMPDAVLLTIPVRQRRERPGPLPGLTEALRAAREPIVEALGQFLVVVSPELGVGDQLVAAVLGRGRQVLQDLRRDVRDGRFHG